MVVNIGFKSETILRSSLVSLEMHVLPLNESSVELKLLLGPEGIFDNSISTGIVIGDRGCVIFINDRH